MKKIIFIFTACLTLGVAKAQENSVKVNPLAFFGGSDLVSYERKLTDNITGLVGAGYASYSFSSLKYTSFGSELQGRYYIKEALKGFYGGVQAGFSGGKVDMGVSILNPSTNDYVSYTAIRIGGKAGYQWLWKSGFTLDLNLGYAFNKFSYGDNGGLVSLAGTGTMPNLGFGLGYSF